MAQSEFAAAAEAIRQHGVTGGIDCAFVLGTGLGPLADELEDAIVIPYSAIPGFPKGNVSGHSHNLCVGMLEGRKVLIYQGRAHFYENGDAAVMRTPIGALAELGVRRLILTNAAGSVNPAVRPGSLVAITDHINFGAPNPLIGDSGDGRFVSMTGAYDAGLRAGLARAAAAAKLKLHEGVYMWFSGPSFETPAEIRVAQRLGADLVGMSTVPEVILARRFGLTVAAVSTVTNLGAGLENASPSHHETREMALAAASDLKKLARAFLAGLNT